MLPLGLGYVEGVTHDYVRHGTTTLFAALDVAVGPRAHPVQAAPSPSGVPRVPAPHRSDPCPRSSTVHLIVDNYCTHKHAKVRRWLAARPRFHVHYTPTYASWLNQVEIWFNLGAI